MSTTRLLLLGAGRGFQPVHGYLLRRELLSWQVEEWAHVKPGSIYSGLRTLVSHGLLAEVPGEPVSYRLTPDGEVEFRRLLVTALREPDPGDASRLLGGLCFMTVLPRTEVREALRARSLVLEAMMSSAAATVRSVEESRLAPASTSEVSRGIGHWLGGGGGRGGGLGGGGGGAPGPGGGAGRVPPPPRGGRRRPPPAGGGRLAARRPRP